MDKIRKNTLNDLKKILDSNISEKVEDSIFTFSDEYAKENNTEFLLKQIYENKSNEILCTLNKNKHIIDKLKNNKINPEKIAFLKDTELNPKNYSEINKKKKKNTLKKNVGTDAYQCKKCKKRKCTVSERQVRSGDEPATLFVKCLECDYTFTLN